MHCRSLRLVAEGHAGASLPREVPWPHDLEGGDAHDAASHFRPLLSCQFFISAQAIHPSSDVMRNVKIYLASWRHSADTGANAYRSKVIGGRFYDVCFASCLVFVEM
jgi:hypothetical protein